MGRQNCSIGTLFSKDQKVELVNYVKEISELLTSDVAIAEQYDCLCSNIGVGR